MWVRTLGSGKYSDAFKVWSSGGCVVALKISYFSDSTIRSFAEHAQHGDRAGAHAAKDKDAVSVSMAMAAVATQLRLHGVSPHIVRVYCEADVGKLPVRFKPLLRDRLARLTPRQIRYSHASLMELYTCNLTDFLSNRAPTDAILRPLLFQVVYTLACLQALFPGFRHNDLSSNNILIKAAAPKCMQYTFGGTTLYTHVPWVAALADFDFVHVPGHDVLSNERVLGGKYGIAPTPNDSYDTHLLFKSVHRCLRKAARTCDETLTFLKSLNLDKTKDRLAHIVSHLSPDRLLRHPYFAPLRARPCPPAATHAMPT